MYFLNEEQIEFIQLDIKNRGVVLEDLQLNLLDHVCCILESECHTAEDFELKYTEVISRFFKNELKEIEEETRLLLTFKNYYAMKKTMIVSGTTAVILLSMGSIFKLMHWPGAGIMLVLGIFLISIIFLPLLFLTKSKEAKTTREKQVMGFGALVGVLYCLSTMFKIMHWPGAFYLWSITIITSAFIFIPLYFFNGIKNAETKVNTMVTSILLVGATSILFMLLNIRPPKKELQLKMYNYLQSEALLNRIQNQQKMNPAGTDEQAQLIAEINQTCTQIKTLIFENTIGEKSLSEDFEARNILIEDKGLGPEFNEQRQGAKLMSELNALLIKYNSISTVKIPVAHSALDPDFGPIANYNVYSVLTSITQLQLFVLTEKS